MHKDVVHPRLSPSSWWAQHRSKKKSKDNKSTSSTGHRRAQTRYQQSLTIANQTLADHSLSWLSTNWGRCLLHRWNTWSEFCRHHWKAYRILANSSKWTKHFKRVDTCSIRSRARGCKLGGRVTATELFFRLFSSNHRGKLKDLRVSKPPRTNLVDIGAVVDWLQFQFIYFRNVKSSLAVLHNQNDMVIHSRPAGCLKSEPRDGMSSKKKSWVSEAQGAVVKREVTTCAENDCPYCDPKHCSSSLILALLPSTGTGQVHPASDLPFLRAKAS